MNNANSITGAQANENEKANSQWMGLVSGLDGDAATVLKPVVANNSGGGNNCWIAAAVYNGWEDQRVHQVPNYIFNVWAKQSLLGAIVAGVYQTIGEQVSWLVRRRAVLRLGFRALFDIALRRS